MSFSSSMKSTANNLLNKYGDDVVLVRRYDCEYNPNTGKDECSTEEIPMVGSVSNYSIQELSDASINEGDLSLTLETDVVLTVDYSVLYKGKEWHTVSLKTVSAQNLTIIYKLQIRSV